MKKKSGEKDNSIVKDTGKRKWWLFGLGCGSLVLCIIMLLLYSQDQTNYISAVGFVVFLAGAVFGIYHGLKKDEGIQVVRPGAVKSKHKPSSAKAPNSITIYVEEGENGKRVPGEIVFEYVDKPQGHPHQLINDGKWYYLHYKLPGQGYKAYALSDTQYFDPNEFGRVLTMPAHRDLFAYNPSLLQRLQPWLLIAGIGIIGLLMVILGSE